MARRTLVFVCLACSSSVDAALARPASRPDRPPRPQRTKKNKYAQFSKVEEVKRSLRFSNIDEPAAEDATALVADAPTQARKRERNKWLYPDETSIDQRDPTTFGFVEIGRVLGAAATIINEVEHNEKSVILSTRDRLGFNASPSLCLPEH